MKRLATLLAGAAVAVSAMASQPTPAQVDSVSAAVAATFIESVRPVLNRMQAQGLPVDPGIFGEYIAKALKGQDIGFTPQSANAYMTAYMQKMHEADTVSASSQKAWLAKAAKTPGAVTTPSGLVLEVITEGEGPGPKADDKVLVNYIGTLSDGTVFDQTNGEAITFGLNQVIPGFTEGLQMMKPGGHYKLYIPSNLAYGPDGAQGVIPGGAALCFDITLEGVNPPEKK